jgi:GWxTD domain-containing protein
MNIRIIRLPVLAIIGIFSAPALSQIPLSPKHKAWLEEEVVYIMTDKEKNVFSKLETEQDRDRFIEEFWRQRDPMPGTPRNEFRDEHYRRIEFANKTFGRDTPIPGWKTDRGRIYIMLGTPADVQRFQTGETHPMEIWLYQGNSRFGQAPFFRLLFFQEGGVGDFKLYNPISDGPKRLLSDSFRLTEAQGLRQLFLKIAERMGLKEEDIPPPAPEIGFPKSWDDMDRQAYLLLRANVSMDLAEATYTMIPGSSDTSLLRSQMLLAEIDSYPKKKVNDTYASDILEHKATVEVSYSVHFMGNRSAVSVFQDPSGLFFLSYVVVPDNLSLDTYLDKYIASLKATLRLSDASGKTLFQQEKFVPIELRKEELKALEKRSFEFHDAIPVIPGDHTFDLLLENTVSKEFTSVEKKISIPGENPLWMSPLVLARKVNMDKAAGGASRAFQVGKLQVYPCLNSTFQQKDHLYVFLQLHGLGGGLEEEGVLEFSFIKDKQIVQSSRKNVRDYENGRDVLEAFAVDKFAPGTHGLKASLLDKGGREILSQSAEFVVTDRAMPGTWVVAQENPPADDPYYSYILGIQFLNGGDIDKAYVELEKANSKKSDSLDYALSFALVLLSKGDPGKARTILLPFGDKEVSSFELYRNLGKASQGIGDPKEAISWYEKALAFRGNLVEVLNSLGECYLKIGDKAQALRAWKKSLEINPKQDNIKKMIEKFEDKIKDQTRSSSTPAISWTVISFSTST